MSEKSIKVNSILNVIKTISSIIFPLITFPYISRVLKPENVGKVNFGTSFVSYFSLIASLGITTYAIRECSAVRGDKKKLGEKASQIFSINVCTTIFAYLLLGLSLIFFRKLDSYRTLIIIQSTAILFTTWGADWLNTAMEDFKFITIRSIGFQFISSILMFMLVHQPDDYLKYAAVTVLSSCGASITNVLYRRKYCTVRLTKDMHWQEHFKPILLLFVMILAQTIFNSSDITMLGFMKGDFEVGIYSTAHKIEGIIAQVVSSLSWVVMPRMSSYFSEGDYDRINDLLRKVFSILVFVGLPLTTGTIALANEIVMIVGGESYQASALPLIILMLSFSFSLLGGSFLGNMVLLPSKNEKIYMRICCIATAINVVLNLLLIRMWGAIAAAGTTAFCSFLMMLMMVITRDKRIKLDYLGKALFVPTIGSALIFGYCKLVLFFFTNLWMKVGICVCGSVCLYVLVSLICRNEILIDIYNAFINKLRR